MTSVSGSFSESIIPPAPPPKEIQKTGGFFKSMRVAISSRMFGKSQPIKEVLDLRASLSSSFYDRESRQSLTMNEATYVRARSLSFYDGIGGAHFDPQFASEQPGGCRGVILSQNYATEINKEDRTAAANFFKLAPKMQAKYINNHDSQQIGGAQQEKRHYFNEVKDLLKEYFISLRNKIFGEPSEPVFTSYAAGKGYRETYQVDGNIVHINELSKHQKWRLGIQQNVNFVEFAVNRNTGSMMHPDKVDTGNNSEWEKAWFEEKAGRNWTPDPNGLATIGEKPEKYLVEPKSYRENYKIDGNIVHINELSKHQKWRLGIQQNVNFVEFAVNRNTGAMMHPDKVDTGNNSEWKKAWFEEKAGRNWTPFPDGWNERGTVAS